MSLGTSIAYLSSIALLVLASKDSSDTTYFDSVVFLSFFVITGRYIEALIRQKTADTISEIKKLRPMEAFLELASVQSQCESSRVDLELVMILEPGIILHDSNSVNAILHVEFVSKLVDRLWLIQRF